MIVVVWRLLGLLALVGPVLILCTGPAAPPPTPTQVLGQAAGGGDAHRFYSSTARYSLVTTWLMATEIDGAGPFDRLSAGTRFLDIAAFAVTHEPPTSALTAAALTTLQKAGLAPKRSRVVSILDQHVPLLIFAYGHHRGAILTFAAAHHIWVFALRSDAGHWRADVAALVEMATSFHLEGS